MSNATLAQRITAALDAPGVHPGDERWFAGFAVVVWLMAQAAMHVA